MSKKLAAEESQLDAYRAAGKWEDVSRILKAQDKTAFAGAVSPAHNTVALVAAYRLTVAAEVAINRKRYDEGRRLLKKALQACAVYPDALVLLALLNIQTDVWPPRGPMNETARKKPFEGMKHLVFNFPGMQSIKRVYKREAVSAAATDATAVAIDVTSETATAALQFDDSDCIELLTRAFMVSFENIEHYTSYRLGLRLQGLRVLGNLFEAGHAPRICYTTATTAPKDETQSAQSTGATLANLMELKTEQTPVFAVDSVRALRPSLAATMAAVCCYDRAWVMIKTHSSRRHGWVRETDDVCRFLEESDFAKAVQSQLSAPTGRVDSMALKKAFATTSSRLTRRDAGPLIISTNTWASISLQESDMRVRPAFLSSDEVRDALVFRISDASTVFPDSLVRMVGNTVKLPGKQGSAAADTKSQASDFASQQRVLTKVDGRVREVVAACVARIPQLLWQLGDASQSQKAFQACLAPNGPIASFIPPQLNKPLVAELNSSVVGIPSRSLTAIDALTADSKLGSGKRVFLPPWMQSNVNAVTASHVDRFGTVARLAVVLWSLGSSPARATLTGEAIASVLRHVHKTSTYTATQSLRSTKQAHAALPEAFSHRKFSTESGGAHTDIASETDVRVDIRDTIPTTVGTTAAMIPSSPATTHLSTAFEHFSDIVESNMYAAVADTEEYAADLFVHPSQAHPLPLFAAATNLSMLSQAATIASPTSTSTWFSLAVGLLTQTLLSGPGGVSSNAYLGVDSSHITPAARRVAADTVETRKRFGLASAAHTQMPSATAPRRHHLQFEETLIYDAWSAHPGIWCSPGHRDGSDLLFPREALPSVAVCNCDIRSPTSAALTATLLQAARSAISAWVQSPQASHPEQDGALISKDEGSSSDSDGGAIPAASLNHPSNDSSENLSAVLPESVLLLLLSKAMLLRSNDCDTALTFARQAIQAAARAAVKATPDSTNSTAGTVNRQAWSFQHLAECHELVAQCLLSKLPRSNFLPAAEREVILEAHNNLIESLKAAVASLPDVHVNSVAMPTTHDTGTDQHHAFQVGDDASSVSSEESGFSYRSTSGSSDGLSAIPENEQAPDGQMSDGGPATRMIPPASPSGGGVVGTGEGADSLESALLNLVNRAAAVDDPSRWSALYHLAVTSIHLGDAALARTAAALALQQAEQYASGAVRAFTDCIETAVATTPVTDLYRYSAGWDHSETVSSNNSRLAEALGPSVDPTCSIVWAVSVLACGDDRRVAESILAAGLRRFPNDVLLRHIEVTLLLARREEFVMQEDVDSPRAGPQLDEDDDHESRSGSPHSVWTGSSGEDKENDVTDVLDGTKPRPGSVLASQDIPSLSSALNMQVDVAVAADRVAWSFIEVCGNAISSYAAAMADWAGNAEDNGSAGGALSGGKTRVSAYEDPNSLLRSAPSLSLTNASKVLDALPTAKFGMTSVAGQTPCRAPHIIALAVAAHLMVADLALQTRDWNLSYRAVRSADVLVEALASPIQVLSRRQVQQPTTNVNQKTGSQQPMNTKESDGSGLPTISSPLLVDIPGAVVNLSARHVGSIDPHLRADVVTAMARLLERVGRTAEAQGEYSLAVSAVPDHPVACIRLAAIQTAKAVVLARGLPATDTNMSSVLTELDGRSVLGDAETLTFKGDAFDLLVSAERLCRTVIRSNGSVGPSWGLLASILYLRRDVGPAAQCSLKAITVSPQSPLHHLYQLLPVRVKLWV
jgi:hypothetical protein